MQWRSVVKLAIGRDEWGWLARLVYAILGVLFGAGADELPLP